MTAGELQLDKRSRFTRAVVPIAHQGESKESSESTIAAQARADELLNDMWRVGVIYDDFATDVMSCCDSCQRKIPYPIVSSTPS